MKIDRIKFATAIAIANLNCKELAQKAGISRVTVTNIKAGKNCSVRTAKKVSESLNVPLTEILETGMEVQQCPMS